MGIQVLGISCITNVLYGKIQEVTHEEVIQNADKVKNNFSKLLLQLIKKF